LVHLRPDSRSVRHAGGAAARILSDPGKQYAIYLDGDGPSSVTLDLPSGKYTGAWVDVRTGSVAKSENFEHRGGERILQSPEFSKGIALRLSRAQP
jgi:hypothetical protein